MAVMTLAMTSAGNLAASGARGSTSLKLKVAPEGAWAIR